MVLSPAKSGAEHYPGMTVGKHLRITESKTSQGNRVLLTKLSVPSSLSFYLAGTGILIWLQVVRDQEAGAWSWCGGSCSGSLCWAG